LLPVTTTTSPTPPQHAPSDVDVAVRRMRGGVWGRSGAARRQRRTVALHHRASCAKPARAGAAKGANPYTYVYNRPTAVIDPNGFEGCAVGMGLVPAWGCSYITNPLGQVKPTSGTVGAYAWTYVTHSGVFDSYIPSVPETGSQTVLAPTTSGEMLDWAPYAVPTDGETETIASLGRGLTDLSFGEGLADNSQGGASSMSDGGVQGASSTGAPTTYLADQSQLADDIRESLLLMMTFGEGSAEEEILARVAEGEAVALEEGAFSRVLSFTERDLQKGFTKHGADFGLDGSWNPSRAADFSQAINQFINDPLVVEISGTYRGEAVTHFFNPVTGVNVIASPAGAYVSGWRLSVGQMWNLFRLGAVQ